MPADERVILDAKLLGSLRELNEIGAPDIVSQLIDMFLEQSPDTLRQLQEQIKVQNAFMIEKLAHKLKGSCANLGAVYLSMLCQELEEKGRQKNVANVADLGQQIELAFAEACVALKRDWWQGASSSSSS